MEITEVRVKLVKNHTDRLKAYCSMTLDDEFVVRDIKIIEGPCGHFVAMPSRKMTDHCTKCGAKNHLKAHFCCSCGRALPDDLARKAPKGRLRQHADIAHPINSKCRQRVERAVLETFKEEVEKSKQPGYEPVELDEPDEETVDLPVDPTQAMI
jgi:stage V sporulation protein G